MTMDVDERATIEAAIRGDPSAQRAIYLTHAPWLYSIACRTLGDRHLAEDALQETFVEAFRGLRGFAGRSRFRTWLYTIQYRVIGRLWATRRRETPVGAVIEAWAAAGGGIGAAAAAAGGGAVEGDPGAGTEADTEGADVAGALGAGDTAAVRRPGCVRSGVGRSVGPLGAVLTGQRPAGAEYRQVENRAWVAQVMGGLPERDRLLLQLAYWDDLTGEEIAEVLGVTPNHAKVLLFRARQRFRAAASAGSGQEEGDGLSRVSTAAG